MPWRDSPVATAPNSMRKSGFSLVELLVATTIMAIVGALAVSCLFPVVHVWERCAADKSAPVFEFIDRFQSDVDSAIAVRGVDGEAGRCCFWIRESPPCKVCHVPAQGGVERVTLAHDDEMLSREIFRGVGKYWFSYGFLDDAGEISWRDSASPDFGSPDFIRVSVEGLPPRIVGFAAGN